MSQGGANSNSGSGGNPIEDLTGNSGGPVGSDASFNIDILGNNTTGIDIVGTPASNLLTVLGLQSSTTQRGTIEIATQTETQTFSSTSLAITPSTLGNSLETIFVVSSGGLYPTIQSAVNAANSAGGGIVYIRPGTYTENITLYQNVHLIGDCGSHLNGKFPVGSLEVIPVQIHGNITCDVSVSVITTTNYLINLGITSSSGTLMTYITNVALLNGAPIVFSGCRLEGASGGYILHMDGSGWAYFYDCYITETTPDTCNFITMPGGAPFCYLEATGTYFGINTVTPCPINSGADVHFDISNSYYSMRMDTSALGVFFYLQGSNNYLSWQGPNPGDALIEFGSQDGYIDLLSCTVIESTGSLANSTNASYQFLYQNFEYQSTFTIGTNGRGHWINCAFSSSPDPAFTMSSTQNVNFSNCVINTVNNPAIAGAGAGTLNLANITFVDNANIAGTLTLGLTSTTKVGNLEAENISITNPLPVPSGGTGLATITDHAVLIGSGTGAITPVGPVASTGALLASNGVGSDPGFTTATYPLTTTISEILYSSAANTVTGLATANRGVLTTGATGIPVITALATDGQLIIGSTAGAPAAASITAGSGITVTPGSNSITIAATGSGDVTAAANLTDNAVVRGDGGAKGVQTSTVLISDAGEMTNPSQPAFLAYLATTATNKTGNGTNYTIGTDALTEVFDQNSDFNTNGTFTAPVTGRYYFSTSVVVTGATVASTFQSILVSSNRNSDNFFVRAAGNQNMTMLNNVLLDMDATDTLTLIINVIGEAGDTDDIFGSANADTFMSGFLVC